MFDQTDKEKSPASIWKQGIAYSILMISEAMTLISEGL